MQIAQRGMAQPQGVDREPPARLGREKRRDGLGRRRLCGMPMHRTPFGRGGETGAVGAPGVLGVGGAPIIGGGGLGFGFGFGEAQRRRRQIDDRFQLEPVAHRVRVCAHGQLPRQREVRAGRPRRDCSIADRFAVLGHRTVAALALS